MNKYVLLKVISVSIAAFSQILLKKSANKEYDSKIREYLNSFVIIGYFLFTVSTIFSVFSLRGTSIAFSSVIGSLNYILVPILSFIFLKERVNKVQLIGMIIIIIGVIIFEL